MLVVGIQTHIRSVHKQSSKVAARSVHVIAQYFIGKHLTNQRWVGVTITQLNAAVTLVILLHKFIQRYVHGVFSVSRVIRTVAFILNTDIRITDSIYPYRVSKQIRFAAMIHGIQTIIPIVKTKENFNLLNGVDIIQINLRSQLYCRSNAY